MLSPHYRHKFWSACTCMSILLFNKRKKHFNNIIYIKLSFYSRPCYFLYTCCRRTFWEALSFHALYTYILTSPLIFLVLYAHILIRPPFLLAVDAHLWDAGGSDGRAADVPRMSRVRTRVWPRRAPHRQGIKTLNILLYP